MTLGEAKTKAFTMIQRLRIDIALVHKTTLILGCLFGVGSVSVLNYERLPCRTRECYMGLIDSTKHMHTHLNVRAFSCI